MSGIMSGSDAPSQSAGGGASATLGRDFVRARRRRSQPRRRLCVAQPRGRSSALQFLGAPFRGAHRGRSALPALRAASGRDPSRRAERPARAQEASFREFCARPENKPLVEKTQQREIRTAQRLQSNDLAARFRERFLASSPEAQRAMAPFLKMPFLRRIVQTLTNDERNDFGHWATNPAIIELLTAAKDAIESGRMSEGEAEQLLLAHAQARPPRGRGWARLLARAWLQGHWG